MNDDTIAVGIPKQSSSSSRQSTRQKESSRKKEDGESRESRWKRRDREDQDSKRKSRSNRSSNAASTPGAHASNGEHKSSSKSSRRSTADDDSKHRSRSSVKSPRRGDEKSGYRKSRGSGPATVPGAEASKSPSSSSRSRKRHGDEKAKERRGTRASKPGAEASTSSKDRSKSKVSGRNKEGEIKVSATEETPQFNEDGEAVVAAMIVEEEEDAETKKERERARMKEMVAAETQKERERMEAENERRREEQERAEAERQEKKRQKKKKRNQIICILVVLLLIGGGVGAFFGLQKDKTPNPVKESTEDDGKTTDPPVDFSESPSLDPTHNPSSGPTNVELEYEQPDLEECVKIANGLSIDGEEEMFDRSFAVAMEVDLADGNEIESRVSELKTQIEKLSIPDLIGCPRELFAGRRGLGHHQTAMNAILSKSVHRHLQSASIRYAIAKAVVTVIVTDAACEKSDSPNCSVVTVNLDLTVRGDERIFLLAGVINEVFPNGEDIQPDLELLEPYDQIVVQLVRSLDPTAAPTTAPTGTASEKPSSIPSSNPSSNPTRAPVVGVVFPDPTEPPTIAPSKTPTTTPSAVPTPTPPPTFAPLPGLTPPPTPPPTARPTIDPSTSPSMWPSNVPSLVPSKTPSLQPSFAPSPAPTIGPTSGPTSSPTTPAPTEPLPLESNLYCGCYRDDRDASGGRDLPHQAPFTDLSQVDCIRYCQSENYKFAGLQNVNECFCGDDAGSYGTSLNCFTVDRDRNGVVDVCANSGEDACYDGSGSCECGGHDANTLFRISQTTSCPSEVPPTEDYLGCKRDTVGDRDLNVLGSYSSSVAQCRNLCKDIGYAYSGVQFGKECYCGNSYGNYGDSSACTSPCQVNSGESGCGGSATNSVYWSGLSPLAAVSDLESNLSCGCLRDVPQQRDLEHEAPYSQMSQKSCILYCRSKGYDFAGLQSGTQCFCGNTVGTHSFSQSCDVACTYEALSGCYDGSNSCTCGGKNANDVFRTSSTSAACPSQTEQSYEYIGCYRDDNINRVMETFAKHGQLVPECVSLCREMGFPFAGLEFGAECHCGNQYNSLGKADNCNVDCSDGSVECGGVNALSVYATGVSSSVSVLEENDLYCGCTADDNDSRDLPHKAPYSDLSQTACIYYCKSQNYKFAALQWINECYCGDSAGSHGASINCDITDKDNNGNADQCAVVDAGSGCYSGTTGCSCGGQNANSLFRTSTSETCPNDAYLISKDYAVASWDSGSTTNLDHVPAKAIDGNTCGDFFGCQSVAEVLNAPTNPYWQVQIGFKITVRKVIVWNRTDCCSDRMFGLDLQLLDGSNTIIESRGITIGENGSSKPASQTFVFSSVQNVAYVRIQRTGSGPLNIAEVQVFS